MNKEDIEEENDLFETRCPKCNGLVEKRMIDKDNAVYDCIGVCKDQIAFGACRRIRVRKNAV